MSEKQLTANVGPGSNTSKDGWLRLCTGQISLHWITQLVSLIVFRWIVIYPVDSAIQCLSNGPDKALQCTVVCSTLKSDSSSGSSVIHFTLDRDQLRP